MNTLNKNSIDIRPFQRANRYISVGKTMGKVLLKIKEARIRHQTIRELQSLTDAQLEDIGIPRYEIRRAVLAKMPQKRKAEFAVGVQQPVTKILKETGYAETNQKIAA